MVTAYQIIIKIGINANSLTEATIKAEQISKELERPNTILSVGLDVEEEINII